MDNTTGVLAAVEALLLWRDPAKTGSVFAAITILYLLLEWSHFSLLTLIANTLGIAVAAAFLWNNLAQFINKYADLSGQSRSDFLQANLCRIVIKIFPSLHCYRPGVPIPAVLQHGISDNQSKMYAQQLTSGINQLLGMTVRQPL